VKFNKIKIMKFRENDVIVSIVDISSVIRKGTKGVILSILEEDKENRLQELIKAVKTTKGYENWEADYNPESLKMLGKWFEENV